MQGLQWGEEIRSPASLAPPAADVTRHEIEGALALMEFMSVERLTELDDQLTDRYTDALIEVIDAIAEHRAWLAGHIHGGDGCTGCQDKRPTGTDWHRLGRGTPSFRAPSTCWWALTLHAVRGRSQTAFVPRPKFRRARRSRTSTPCAGAAPRAQGQRPVRRGSAPCAGAAPRAQGQRPVRRGSDACPARQ
ncbi:hypothetical protein [Streptomyces sp. NPDC093111]|uniref:hypothetical protein n=1 Tax=Streptomyces sp. NPDC093111 TaxID=3154978 RepID=UPI0034138F13